MTLILILPFGLIKDCNNKFFIFQKMNALCGKDLEQYLKRTINKIKVGYTIIEDNADRYFIKFWSTCQIE